MSSRDLGQIKRSDFETRKITVTRLGIDGTIL